MRMAFFLAVITFGGVAALIGSWLVVRNVRRSPAGAVLVGLVLVAVGLWVLLLGLNVSGLTTSWRATTNGPVSAGTPRALSRPTRYPTPHPTASMYLRSPGPVSTSAAGPP